MASDQIPINFGENTLDTEKLHPSAFLVKNPLVLIDAKDEFKLIEYKIYHEILNNNHANEPDRLAYEIPYTQISESTGRQAVKNAKQHIDRVAKELMKKSLFLTAKDYEILTGEKEAGGRIVPFPKIVYRNKSFVIHLQEDFKKALILAKQQYLGGELGLLRSLKSVASIRLYWAIRDAQRKGKREKSFLLDELKDLLGLSGQYSAFKDFRKRVLEVIKKEFENRWTNFDYEVIRRGRGRGGGVHGVKFTFLADKELERELKDNLKKDWQIKLHFTYDFPIGIVQNLTKMTEFTEPIFEGSEYWWDDYYIDKTIWICEQEINKGKWVSKRPKIKNPSSYIFRALFDGTFVEKIAGMRKKHSTNLGENNTNGKERNVRGEELGMYSIEEFKIMASNYKLTIEQALEQFGYYIKEVNGEEKVFKR